ncbi:MAG: hypothetical protein QM330_09460 [Acidobacteriota bacterium]|jgi:hypothetical protein|nr:hypothetical protein [Acidobacteriota bacterium]NLT33493.1 hypothetical protein [Acidobacteriota bacterium]
MNYYNYFTEIEEHFVRRRGRHLLISPNDWNLIAAWREAGIPLHIALRGIDIAMESFQARRGRGQSKVNSLCYCHDAVMEAYADYTEAHVGEDAAAEDPAPSGLKGGEDSGGDDPGASEIAAFLAARIDEINALAAKQYPGGVPEGLERVQARLEEIARFHRADERMDMEALERDLRILDDLLMDELGGLVPAGERADWERDAAKELKEYRKRLPKETFERIRENFMCDRIREKFRIGELSLFRL